MSSGMYIEGIAFGGGISAHLGYFAVGEHHMRAVSYIQTAIALLLVSFGILVLSGRTPSEACYNTAYATAFFSAGLYGSLLVYRLLLSPLRRFPGPWFAKISSFDFAIQAQNGKAHTALCRLHQKYGPFVRVGSSDLSVIHPKAVNAIYGRGSPCIKADWYDMTAPRVSLHATRQRELHDQRRRNWNLAFTSASINSYEKRILKYQEQLIAYIDSQKGAPIEAQFLSDMYSFDVLGDLAFGKSFQMLENKQQHKAIKSMHSAVEPAGLYFPVWFFRMFLVIPGAMSVFWEFTRHCREHLEKRMHSEPDLPDIMSALLQPYIGKEITTEDMDNLAGDSELVVIAGSDTNSVTFTCVLYELANNPSCFTLLQEEIGDLKKSGKEFSNENLQSLDYLNGVINEAMRLYPAAGMLQRKTPPEGLDIGGSHVPGNTTIFAPFYVVGRSEEVYAEATAFKPERWFANKEMVKEPSAFAPFSTGPYNCVGKPLALLNLRTTTARLVDLYDISFAEGEDGTNFHKNMRQNFGLLAGDVRLKFQRRK